MLDLPERLVATLAAAVGPGEQESLGSCHGSNPSLLSLTTGVLTRPRGDSWLMWLFRVTPVSRLLAEFDIR